MINETQLKQEEKFSQEREQTKAVKEKNKEVISLSLSLKEAFKSKKGYREELEVELLENMKYTAQMQGEIHFECASLPFAKTTWPRGS